MGKPSVNICNNMTIEHDLWAGIDSDLLDAIIKHVDYDSYVRIRAVCRRWHCELPKNPKYIENLSLVLPFDNEEETFRPFFNIGENKGYYIKLPEMQNTIFRSSYYDWLITIAIDGTVRMLNPFTRVHVDLPPFLAFPNVIDYQPDNEEYILRTKGSKLPLPLDKVHIQKMQIKKLIISSQSEHEHVQDFMALAIYGERSQLCYCRLGDNNWTAFRDLGTIIDDATFYKGKIYVVNWKGQLYKFRFGTGRRRTVLGGIVPVTPPKDIVDCYSNTTYVVGSPLGLLLVNRQLDVKYDETKNDYYYKTCGFNIYKLGRDGKKFIWLEVNNLNDYVLLLGYNTSVCILPQTLPDGKGNRIYYTDDKFDLHFRQFIGGQDIGMFDLEDGSFNRLFSNLEQLFPAPVWLLKKAS